MMNWTLLCGKCGKKHLCRFFFLFQKVDVVRDTFHVSLLKLLNFTLYCQVNVDVISFGEVELNQDVLTKFIETVNGRDGSGSNLVAIPPGPHLSDALVSSPILAR